MSIVCLFIQHTFSEHVLSTDIGSGDTGVHGTNPYKCSIQGLILNNRL